MDLKPHNKNAAALRALMKNEKLSKLINEAVQSPPGSTSRLRVQKMLSSLRRTGVMDGSGGIGRKTYQTIPKVNMQPWQQDYSNLAIFKAAPEIRIPFGAKPPIPAPQVTMDGAGGPGTLDFSVNPTESSSFPSILGSQSSVIGAPNAASTSQGGFLSSAFNSIKNLFPTGTKTASAQGAPTPPAPGSNLPYTNVASILGVGANQNQQTSEGTPQEDGGSYSSGFDPGTAISTPPAPTTYGSTAPIESAVQAGVGPTAFAYGALNQGPEYLKTLPGMANLPPSLLKGGATLGERINDLSDTLKMQYHLDSLLDEQTTLINQGVGITSRLTDYIRGRDEFLNKTDNMLESFKDKVLTMNTADPEIKQSAQMYQNYLYTLRGRQNKRYIEFLNQSVETYNNKLDATQKMYQSALDGYKQDLTLKAAVTQSEYEQMFSALTDMYNSVAEAPKKALEMQKLEYEKWSAYYKALKDERDAGMSGQNSATFGADREALKDAGYIDSLGRWVINDNALLAVGNPTNFMPIMIDSAYRAMTYQSDDGKISPNKSNIIEIGENVLGQLDNLKQTGRITENDYLTMVGVLQQKTARALTKTGNFNPTTAGPAIRSAIQDLAEGDYKSWWPGGGTKGDVSLSKFLESNQNSGLDSDSLQALYRAFQGYDGTREDFGQAMLKTLDDNTGQWVDTTDEALTNFLTASFAKSLRPSAITSSPTAFNSGGAAGTNRPQRNNNPLNIKASSATSTYTGVVGIDPTPATDGGRFLTFDSPQSGFNAAVTLLKNPNYANLTVDAALRRWSNNGYGGEISPSLASRKVASLNESELQSLVKTMAYREGYYA